MTENGTLTRAIAEQIRVAREAKGWTQDQAADAAGVSKRAYQDAESGRVKTQAGKLSKIRRALDMEGDPQATREGWDGDIQVFLDVMGAYLSTMPAERRRTVYKAITAEIMGSVQQLNHG